MYLTSWGTASSLSPRKGNSLSSSEFSLFWATTQFPQDSLPSYSFLLSECPSGSGYRGGCRGGAVPCAITCILCPFLSHPHDSGRQVCTHGLLTPGSQGMPAHHRACQLISALQRAGEGHRNVFDVTPERWCPGKSINMLLFYHPGVIMETWLT